jgi:hypothetical protein
VQVQGRQLAGRGRPGPPAEHLGFDVRGGHLRTIDEHAESHDGVLEFAHVAGPRVLLQAIEGRLVEGERSLGALRLPRQERLRQIADVLGPFAQGRHGDLEHGEAVEQVFAEAAVLHLRAQVAVGGGDEAHVDVAHLIAADRADLPELHGPQQRRLQIERQFADFVEEQCAAVGGFEETKGASGRRR